MLEIERARGWYPSADPVHGFDHILRVLRMAERLAALEQADPEIVRAAVLLHDAVDPDLDPAEHARVSHHHASARFARRVLLAEGWSEERIQAVEHCIRAHRFRDDREPPQTIEAQVLFDADKLDAIGAIGAARAVAYAALHGQPAYRPPSPVFIAQGVLAEGEGHTAYHEFIFKLGRIKDRLFTASAQEIGRQRHAFMQDFFERLGNEIEGIQ